MPSAVDHRVSLFDRFAGAASRVVSRAWFFAACVLLVIVWAPSYFLIRDVNTWQLIINTLTTIVTFLLVALLQNAQTRADAATQHKLNALAAGLGALMAAYADDPATPDASEHDLDRAIGELRAAVGLERRESS
jgi:cytochrome c-type biogenesis protein CcmH/NrfG